MRVLYIENGSTRSESITRCFQARGGDFVLEVAAGATEAIARIEDRLYDGFDTALVDGSVPDHECAELIRYVRDRRLRLSVIVCSYGTDPDRILMVNGGFVAGPHTIAYGSIDHRAPAANGGPQRTSVANGIAEREPLPEAI